MSIYGNVFPEQNTCSDSKPTCVQTVIFCVDSNSLLQTGWGGVTLKASAFGIFHVGLKP